MNLPEQGISGPFRITTIKHILPQKRPEDEDAGQGFVFRPVTGIFIHQSNDVWTLEFDSGDTLGVTANHPVYSTTAQDWRLAGELAIGEQVLTHAGSATLTGKRPAPAQRVYNLEVQAVHNFLVAEVGVVVHNACSKALVKKYLDEAADLADLPDGPQKSALQKLKQMKDSGDPNYQKFLDDFPDDVPLDLGASGVNAWKKAPDALKKDINFIRPFSELIDNVNFKKHLFDGDIVNGETKGVHYYNSVDGDMIKKVGNPSHFYPDGSIKRVKVQKKISGSNYAADKWSSFFPHNWTKDEILEQVAYVKSKMGNKVNDFIWEGPSLKQLPNGQGPVIIKVKMRMENGEIIFDSAFPKT